MVSKDYMWINTDVYVSKQILLEKMVKETKCSGMYAGTWSIRNLFVDMSGIMHKFCSGKRGCMMWMAFWPGTPTTGSMLTSGEEHGYYHRLCYMFSNGSYCITEDVRCSSLDEAVGMVLRILNILKWRKKPRKEATLKLINKVSSHLNYTRDNDELQM